MPSLADHIVEKYGIAKVRDFLDLVGRGFTDEQLSNVMHVSPAMICRYRKELIRYEVKLSPQAERALKLHADSHGYEIDEVETTSKEYGNLAFIPGRRA